MAFKIVLDAESQAFVQHMLDSGRFEHASDVVLEALELLRDRERLREVKLAEFDAFIEEGMADIRAGRVHDLDEVFDDLDRIIQETETERSRDAAE